MKNQIQILLISLLALILHPSHHTQAAGGTIYYGDPTTYQALVNALQPGDTLILKAGTYTDGLFLIDLSGSPAAPIRIQGPSAGPPAIFVANPCICFNTIEIQNASYIEIDNLELDGQQLAGVDAVKAGGDQFAHWAHHITLENLYIHDHDNGQQTVGISTKIPAWNWTIRGNIIDRAGTGLYLGNSDGNAPFVGGLIEGNLIRDTLGYNMQIKHQNGRPAVPGMPTAEAQTIIRHNVFSKASSAATGEDARPNLLVGHWPLSGSGATDHYEIYGNFFYQNPTGEPLFQGEGNIALYDNLFFDNTEAGDAIWVRQHNDDPQTINIFHNTIVAADRGIQVVGVDTNYTQRVVANAIFAPTPLDLDGAVITADNITDTFANAATYLVNPTGTPGSLTDPLDLYPLPGTLTGPPIHTTPFVPFTHSHVDFNQTPRPGTFRGAYAGAGSNPGWLPALTRKPLSPFTPTHFIYLPFMIQP